MKDIIFATFDPSLSFAKNEKVIAYNWFEKSPPFRFGTCIEKYSKDKDLIGDVNCIKTETINKKIYNIGTYKIIKLNNCSSYISIYDREDANRERKNAKKQAS